MTSESVCAFSYPRHTSPQRCKCDRDAGHRKPNYVGDEFFYFFLSLA